MERPPHSAARRARKRLRTKRPASFRTAFGTAAALTSDDGVVAFKVQSLSQGIYVERIEMHAGDACVSQTVRFESEEGLRAWCALDSLRFTYPLVYANLQRTCRELLAAVA